MKQQTKSRENSQTVLVQSKDSKHQASPDQATKSENTNTPEQKSNCIYCNQAYLKKKWIDLNTPKVENVKNIRHISNSPQLCFTVTCARNQKPLKEICTQSTSI